MNNHKLRIIGGQWRSRRLPIAAVEGLRPTPDRVRETLFNWLQAVMQGATCMDLFAGTGALGLEALSRGAASCLFLEKNPKAFMQLKVNAETLQVKPEQFSMRQQEALSYLQREVVQPVALIFLDPPFRQGLLEQAIRCIIERGWLAKNGFIYVEHEAELVMEWGSWSLDIHRETRAGQVHSLLLQHAISS